MTGLARHFATLRPWREEYPNPRRSEQKVCARRANFKILQRNARWHGKMSGLRLCNRAEKEIQRNSMNPVVRAVIAAVIFSIGVESVQAQTTTLRYGQIPSTAKSVSALHFNIAQRKGLFVREGINVEMISILC
jgi:hypothetical protein